MWALINKSNLSITQLFEVFYNNFDSENFVQIEVPEGINLRFLKVVYEDGVYTIEEDNLAIIAANKASRIAALNDQTWATIMAQAKVIYGSDDPILVLASHSTFQDMVSHPSSYVGSIFADDAAVLAYAEPKLTASSLFGEWRLGVLISEQVQKAAILAE
jgi:hypothetical protein